MRAWVWLSALGLTGLAGCGGGSADTPAGGALITGIVVAQNGDPVQGATARIDGSSFTAKSAADGTFELRDVPAGNYQVVVEATTNNALQVAVSQAFRFDASRRIDLGKLTLRNVGTAGVEVGEVTGLVVDTAGTAVIGAAVELRNAARTLSTRTGILGSFAFRDVPAGSYTLSATVVDGGGVERTASRPDIMVGTSPGARLVQNAGLVVAPATQTGLLEGQVTAEQNRPVSGARVTAEVLNGDGVGAVSYVAVTDTAGRYLFGALPRSDGGLRVAAGAAGYATKSGKATIVAGGTATLDLSLTSDAGAFPPAPTGLDALAVTFPQGGANRGLAAAAAARHRAVGGRLARFGPAGPTTRVAPGGSQIAVEVRFAAVDQSDLAGFVLYRGLSAKPTRDFIEVARSDSPWSDELLDLSRALSVATGFWYRVATLTTQGKESDLSDAVGVTPLDPLEARRPADGDTSVNLPTLTFEWAKVGGVKGYQVTLFEEFPGVGQAVFYQSPPLTAARTSWAYDGPDLAPNEDYFWFVAGFDAQAPGDATAESYSLVQTFTTEPAPAR